MPQKNTTAIDELLTRGVERIYPSTEALAVALKSGKKLRLYNGIDPTAPTLHIGHGIILKKLRDFQRLGHEVIMLIGDFTGQIGDPTDKLATRKQLTREEILANCRKYKEQASKFLDFKSTKNPVQLRFNSEWSDPLSARDVLEIAAEFTVNQFLARDMFKKRIADKKEIHIHEFLYPLFQGYDSVGMDVDMEVGGNDQTFNMLIGRDMQKRRGKEKYVFAMKLLVDPTGKKMGKTEGNMITLDDASEKMYEKVMMWGDEMIVSGFELCTDVPIEEVQAIEKELKDGKTNPRDVKMHLAREIVTLYHGAVAAKKAEENFRKVFQAKGIPDGIRNVVFGNSTSISTSSSTSTITTLLVETELVASKSEARRVVEQGGVKVDNKVVRDANAIVKVSKKGVVIQKGKRDFARVMLG